MSIEAPHTSPTNSEPLAYQVNQFCKLAGISRTTAYSLFKTGKLKSFKLGGRTLIPRSEAERIAKGEVR